MGQLVILLVGLLVLVGGYYARERRMAAIADEPIAPPPEAVHGAERVRDALAMLELELQERVGTSDTSVSVGLDGDGVSVNVTKQQGQFEGYAGPELVERVNEVYTSWMKLDDEVQGTLGNRGLIAADMIRLRDQGPPMNRAMAVQMLSDAQRWLRAVSR